MIEIARKPILKIPCEREEFDAFRSRLLTLIRDGKTHVYVDTSFLMWMTKIGSQSRKELLDWLKANCEKRVHVPIWAAHEYLKHHVAGTIVAELNERTDEITALVGQTYTYFRPFIDEISGKSGEDPAAIRATTRSALNSLDRLASIARQWPKSYQKHSSEVIAFINASTPETTPVYSYFKELTTIGTGRFVGSIPPGFQDRRKKGSGGSTGAAENNEAPADSNRLGDLVFWKELLDHARVAKARAIVVLTNDRKNDWYLGRSDAVQTDASLIALKKSWKPIPRPHPMLVMEAGLVAQTDELELLDAPYLAALLRDVAAEEIRSFADVAIIPDGPEPKNEDQRREKLIKERQESDRAKASADADEKGYLFPDSSAVKSRPTDLRRALLESRLPLSGPAESLLDEWRSTVEAQIAISERLTQTSLEGFDHRLLVGLARELHDRVLRKEPGYLEVLSDLVSALDVLPPNTATCLYLGFLSSMYLERERNTPQFPPRSPLAQLLFDRQSAPYASNAIAALAKRLEDSEVRPVYVPNVDAAPVAVKLETEPDTPGLNELRSMRVGDVELLTAAQADENLRLSALFGAGKLVDGDALVQKACELFAIPIGQVERTETFPLSYSLTDTIGFKRPVDVSIPKELDLAN